MFPSAMILVTEHLTEVEPATEFIIIDEVRFTTIASKQRTGFVC